MKTTRNLRQLLFAAAITLAVLSIRGDVFAQGYPNCGGGSPTVKTNSGTEFLLVYMANETADYVPQPDTANYQNIYIASIGDTATVTITCKANGYKKTLFLQARQGVSIQLNADPTKYFVVNSDEIVDSTVVRVTASSPIVVYGMNHKTFTADAFLALPRNVAGTGYMVMSYPNSSNSAVFGNSLHPSEFAVAAFDDGTDVTYTPTVMTASGIQPGVPHTIALNAGECVQVQADLGSPDADLTGTTVTSSKPVAVFGGHRRTEVAHGYSFFDDQGGQHSSRDHLAEEMPPTSAWGQAFIARNFPPRQLGDYMRVLSSDDNDSVYINGVISGAPLAKGAYRDVFIPYDAANNVNNILAIQTSKRSLVGMYCHTANSANGLGDPFFAIVPPVDQAYHDFTYFISTDPVYTEHYLIIATEQSGAGKITINPPAAALPSAAYTNVPTALQVWDRTLSKYVTKSYSVAVAQQTVTGINRIITANSNDLNGFTILAYGFATVDSYGYTAGGLFVPNGVLWKDAGPVSLPYPGKPEQPSFAIRNIGGDDEAAWLDSIRISYTSNPENIPVAATNVPMTNFGVLPIGQTQRITLAPRTTPTLPITGVARIYHHTGLWFDLQPLEVDFTIEPGTTAAVGTTTATPSTVNVYPNPTQSDATLEFALAAAGHTTVRIYDALGRVMLTAADGMFGAGENTVHIDTHSLTNGSYIYEISSPQSGLTARGHLVVAH